MARLKGDPQGAGVDLFDWSTDQRHALGERFTTGDGRTFRYALAGAVALVPGNALQAPAQVANHLNLTVTAAAAVGATKVSVTLGATAAAQNAYKEGVLVVSTTPGNGYAYRIAGHAAIGSGGSGDIYLEDPIQVALTTSSKVDLQANPYAGVIQTPVTTLTGAPVGGAVSAIAAASYGWIQTRGQFAGLIDGTPGVSFCLSCPAAVAGGFAINSGTLAIVGRTLVTGVDTKNKSIFLLFE